MRHQMQREPAQIMKITNVFYPISAFNKGICKLNNEMYRIQMYIYMANENDMHGFTPGKSCKDK
jgi:hypothetical protein